MTLNGLGEGREGREGSGLDCSLPPPESVFRDILFHQPCTEPQARISPRQESAPDKNQPQTRISFTQESQESRVFKMWVEPEVP